MIFLRLALYGFGILAPVHLLASLFAMKGPEVFIEFGSYVTNRVELNLLLACGYATLAAFAALLLSLEAD